MCPQEPGTSLTDYTNVLGCCILNLVFALLINRVVLSSFVSSLL